MALKDSSGVWDVYLKWHEYHLEKHDKDDFAGIENNEISNQNKRYELKKVPLTASEPDVFKNYEDL